MDHSLMGTVVDTRIPADDFCLEHTFSEVPNIRIELVRAACHGDNLLPLVATNGARSEQVNDALAADATINSVTPLSAREFRSTFWVDWADPARELLNTLRQKEVTLLSAVGEGGQWKLSFLYPDDDPVSSIFAEWKHDGLNLSVKRVNGAIGPFYNDRFGVTEEQYEALIQAVESDYYEIPRGTNLKGLACELKISHQALSERLRRGHKNLVENTLIVDHGISQAIPARDISYRVGQAPAKGSAPRSP